MTYADYITKLTPEEIRELRKRIEAIIGTKQEAKDKARDLSQRITIASAYDKQFQRLAMIYAEKGAKALSLNYKWTGNHAEGITPEGKRWSFDMNWGCTQRSWWCGSLYMEGIGCIFTSGRIDKAFEYILNN